MALIGLSEAAKYTGKNRTTIFRAMKTGRLSFSVNGDGERRVDTSELDRVFRATDADNSQSNSTGVAVLTAQLEAERRANALLERSNDDLRQRLDASEAERRNVHAQLTALLSDKRESPAAEPPPAGPLLRRVLGWLIKQHT
jgi:hypothetical protein